MGSPLSRGQDAGSRAGQRGGDDNETVNVSEAVVPRHGQTSRLMSAMRVQTVRVVSPVRPGAKAGDVEPVLNLNPVYVVEEEDRPPPRDVWEVFERTRLYFEAAVDPSDPNLIAAPESVVTMMKASGLAFGLGWSVGGWYHARVSEREFKERNRNTIFKGQLMAQREANWAAVEGIFLRGLPVGVRMATTTAMVMGGAALIDVQRQNESPLNFAAAGGITGFLFSLPYGFKLCRLATGTSFVFAGLAGLALKGITALEEYATTDEMRMQRHEREARERQVRIDRTLARYQTMDHVISALEATAAITDMSSEPQEAGSFGETRVSRDVA